jgi:diaminohydroxyphosphoribosylaminopyrimidine deaminase/5-amino-6-(5-phosphoribosylamino)uracil reductase
MQFSSDDEKRMLRCLSLAARGRFLAAPNPMVGAVIVRDGEIIAEGWHKKYGGPHAEVEAVKDARKKGYSDLSDCSIYVNLEPCNFHGNTPPCSELIVREKFKEVVIGTKDPHPRVAGTGVRKIQDAGIKVRSGLLTESCMELNRIFFTAQQKKRPWILLKWAQTADAFVASKEGPVRISNKISDRLVHEWRAGLQSILVGKQTAIKDNPRLSVRLPETSTELSPIRIFIDAKGELGDDSNLLDGTQRSIHICSPEARHLPNCERWEFPWPFNLEELLHKMFEEKIYSLMVEGGPKTIQGFLDSGLWDEARVIKSENTLLQGVSANAIPDEFLSKKVKSESDEIIYYRNT